MALATAKLTTNQGPVFTYPTWSFISMQESVYIILDHNHVAGVESSCTRWYHRSQLTPEMLHVTGDD